MGKTPKKISECSKCNASEIASKLLRADYQNFLVKAVERVDPQEEPVTYICATLKSAKISHGDYLSTTTKGVVQVIKELDKPSDIWAVGRIDYQPFLEQQIKRLNMIQEIKDSRKKKREDEERQALLEEFDNVPADSELGKALGKHENS